MDADKLYEIYSICTTSSLNLLSDVLIPLILEGIGAFLGVFGAIWLSKKEARDKRRELVRSLQEELKQINSELEERLQYKGERDYYRYPTQVWDINSRSEILSSLSLKDYKTYVDVYSQIEFAQEIEREWFHSSLIVGGLPETEEDFRISYITALDNKRWELAENIYKSIKNLLNSK